MEQCSLIGKKVLVRTYSAGVHFGTLEQREGKEVILTDAHRVYYWKGAATLSQLANEGVGDVEESKISMAVKKIILTEAIEIIHLKSKAFKILTQKLWKV